MVLEGRGFAAGMFNFEFGELKIMTAPCRSVGSIGISDFSLQIDWPRQIVGIPFDAETIRKFGNQKDRYLRQWRIDNVYILLILIF